MYVSNFHYFYKSKNYLLHNNWNQSQLFCFIGDHSSTIHPESSIAGSLSTNEGTLQHNVLILKVSFYDIWVKWFWRTKLIENVLYLVRQ